MILSGKDVAESLYQDLSQRFAALGREVRLGIVIVGHNPVIESFVKIKVRSAEKLGIKMVRIDLPDSSTTEEVIATIQRLVIETDSVIAQLPMPKQVDITAVLSAIPPSHDVDALNPSISDDDRPVFAPVALAVVELLHRGGVDLKGKKAVVVGAGRLVGSPSAHLLKRLGADVSMVTLEQGSLDELKTADVGVLGAGNPGFIKPDMIKEGIALIDAGTSESAGKICGDADPACAEKASVFTPVPGGVGPVAVAKIFENLLTLISHR
ncbi:MAG: bifunctional protein : 5,10-methylene-tetrahydrofolate dehydrogenase [Candidatus Parcubacteria bacterium]|jgi:methylenetetrahydrofolate dehydrogenase (NADP+)/methenyltetrahydrofolate cyclohydrolase